MRAILTLFLSVCTLFLSVCTLFALCACNMLQMIDPNFKIPMPHLPKISLPGRNTVAKLIPGMAEKDKVDADDPDVPFNSRGTLGFGHTLRIEVYEGARNPDRIYRGITMVDKDGVLALGEAGSARVGGQTLPKAADAIATVFRLAGRNTRPITIHIVSVENTSIISINGDVRDAEFIPVFKEMSVQHAVTVTGGRKPDSTMRGVYIAREGQRHFFTSLEAADDKWSPQAGDIITLSPDI